MVMCQAQFLGCGIPFISEHLIQWGSNHLHCTGTRLLPGLQIWLGSKWQEPRSEAKGTMAWSQESHTSTSSTSTVPLSRGPGASRETLCTSLSRHSPDPAAGASLACPDPSWRHEPANLPRSKRLPALPALAALPRWRSNGLSLEAPGRQRKLRASYKACVALARGRVPPAIPRRGTRLQGSWDTTSLQQGSWKPCVPTMERTNIVFFKKKKKKSSHFPHIC